jgi:hypothetical protein
LEDFLLYLPLPIRIDFKSFNPLPAGERIEVRGINTKK